MKQLSWFWALVLISSTIFSSCNDDNSVVDTDKKDYDNASGSKGGIMYDKFWSAEAEYNKDHQYYTTVSEKGDFFRCKQCHGWDGLGNAGAYISRGPKTTRPSVSSLNLYQIAQSKTAQELFEEIKQTEGRRDISYDLSTYDPATNATEGDKMPNYSQLLTDAQIWDIVKFMKEGMFDVSKLYGANYTGTYPTGSYVFTNVGLDGDESKGNSYYAENCAACHGSDGTSIDLEGKTVGNLTRSKAYEVQHKVKYGQLGSVMQGMFDITLSEMKDLYKALSNKTNFPD